MMLCIFHNYEVVFFYWKALISKTEVKISAMLPTSLFFPYLRRFEINMTMYIFHK